MLKIQIFTYEENGWSVRISQELECDSMSLKHFNDSGLMVLGKAGDDEWDKANYFEC